MLKKVNRFITTGFYTGYLPFAPGTFGSLLAIFLLLLFPSLTSFWGIILLLLLAVLTSHYDEFVTKIKDDSRIVIDEIAGVMVTFIGIPLNWWWLLIGFIFFRLFDILKPTPIRDIQKLPGGIGVVLDDLLAGLLAQLVLRIMILLV